MSTTSAPVTFLDLVTFAREHTRSDSTTTTTNKLKRLLNTGLQDLAIQRNWSWAERRAVLQTHATYSTGTVSVALATRTTVDGVGTLWNTAVTGMGFTNARAGGKVTLAGGVDVYTVATVVSDTQLTLETRYVGTSALSAATYTYFEDEYALAADFFRVVDVRRFSEALPIPIVSRQEFYARWPRNAVTGTPTIATIVDLAPSGSTTPQPRVVLHPVPSTMLNVPYRYITRNLAVSSIGAAQEAMSADADEPIIPLRYRMALVWYAVAQWYRDGKDDARAADHEAKYEAVVARMANDSAPETDRARLVPVIPRTRRRRGGRWSTGSAFDALRDREW